MPPRPYDLHVHRLSGFPSPLLYLITAGLINSFPSDRGWWVSTSEVENYATKGEVDDPESPWFVSPHDRADQDALDALTEAHRSNWPEIYLVNDPAPSI
jgi:hypothetical protein